MIQCTAAIYDDGSATLTINGRRRKIREQNPQEARASILAILVRDADALNEDHTLTAFESDDQHRFVIHADGTISQPAIDQDGTAAQTRQPQPVGEPDDFDMLEDTSATGPIAAIESGPDHDGPTPQAKHPPVIVFNRTVLIRIMASLAILSVLISAGLTSFHLVIEHRYETALSACQTSMSGQRSAFDTFTSNLQSTEPATRITAGQVADATTIDTLHHAFSSDPVMVNDTCSRELSHDQLTALAARLDARAAELRDEAQKVSAAADAVVASRDTKVLADAKASLAQAVTAAQGTLDSSHGKVADNKTRETLQQAIDAANKVLSDKSMKDPKQYQDAQSKLTAPVKAVNASVAAKAATDTAAAQTQTAARAKAGTHSYSHSSRPSASHEPSGTRDSSSATANRAAPPWNVPSTDNDEGEMGKNDPSI